MFLKVLTKNVDLPNGKNMNLEMIDHLGAVLIVPFLNKSEVVMIRQYRASIDEYLYELPAGTIEAGEDILNCAKREIIEETGYEALDWQELGFIYPCPGYSNEKIFIFKAENLTANKALPQDEEEIIEVEIFNQEKIKTFLKEGKITDSKTIAAFVFCGWLK